MTGWTQVRWTQARQVAELMGDDEADWPPPEATPADHYAALRRADALEEAVRFLGCALPRYEAVVWAGRMVEDEAAGAALRPADRRALDHALRWLGDPEDAFRRTAHEAGRAAGERAPERMLAMAVFFSGGSIAPPELPPVQPAPDLAGRFAGAAIRLAAHRGGQAPATLARALAVGERIAAEGVAGAARR